MFTEFLRNDPDDHIAATTRRITHDDAHRFVRKGLRDDSWRFRITVLGDYLAKICLWMKAGPTCYPDAPQFQRVLEAAGLRVRIEPMWGGTPFNNFLIVGER